MKKVAIHCLIDILKIHSSLEIENKLKLFLENQLKEKISFLQIARDKIILDKLDENSFFIFITEGDLVNFSDLKNFLWHLPSKILIALLPQYAWGFSLEQENFIKEIKEIPEIELYLIYKDWDNFLSEIKNKVQSHIDNEAGRNSVLTSISRKSYQGLGKITGIKNKKLKIIKLNPKLKFKFKQNNKNFNEIKLTLKINKSQKLKKLKFLKKDNKISQALKELELKPLNKKQCISLKKRQKALIKKNLFSPKLAELKTYFYEPLYEEEQAPEFNFKNTIIGLFSALVLILAIAISPIKSAFFLILYFLAAFFLNPNKKSSGIRRFFEILIKILFYGLVIIWDYVLVLVISKTAILFFTIPLLIVYLKIKHKKITKQEGVKNFFIYSFIVDWIAFILLAFNYL